MATNSLSVVDATDIFDSSASELRVKTAVEAQFPCELIKREDEFDPIDFDWLNLFGEVVAHVELKARRYASTSLIAQRGPVIGLAKYSALRCEELRSGVPSYLFVEWDDSIIEFAPISAVARGSDGRLAVLPNQRRHRRERRSDHEGQVFFPADVMTRLDARTPWPFDPPQVSEYEPHLLLVAA